MSKDIEHLEFELRSLRKLHYAANIRLKFLEEENNRLKLQIQNLNTEKQMFIQMKQTQDQLVRQNLITSNSENSKNLDTISKLREKIRDLGGDADSENS
jgi:phage shock protein A